MSWISCPVCSKNNPPRSIRCGSCAADFTDPDVLAMMNRDVSDVIAPDIVGGSLAHSKLLGVSEQSLEDGTGVRKLAITGVILLLAGFFLPIKFNFVDSANAWKVLEHAPTTALLFPLFAIVLGIVAYAAPLLPWQRSVALLIAGIGGPASLPFIAEFSGSPDQFLPLIWFGLILGAWGLILRGFDAQSDIARKILIAGTAITMAGFFIPISNGNTSLPFEVRVYFQEALGSASPIRAYSTVLNRDPTVFFSVMYLFLPFFLLPMGVALSMKKPTGAWDKAALLLKPITWLIVLYVPIGFALFIFNMMGYEPNSVYINGHYITGSDFSSAALSGRFRLFLLASGFSIWATLPIVAVIKEFFPTMTRAIVVGDSASTDTVETDSVNVDKTSSTTPNDSE